MKRVLEAANRSGNAVTDGGGIQTFGMNEVEKVFWWPMLEKTGPFDSRRGEFDTLAGGTSDCGSRSR